MTEWMKPPDYIVELVKQVIDDFHEDLQLARIAILMRETAPKSKGKYVHGKAEKISDKWKRLLPERYDFLIWFADDKWQDLAPKQRIALIDHELCHCQLVDGEDPKIVGHDVEEFAAVIQRHGLWHYELERTAEAIQQHLPLEPSPRRKGKLVGLDPDAMGKLKQGLQEAYADDPKVTIS